MEIQKTRAQDISSPTKSPAKTGISSPNQIPNQNYQSAGHLIPQSKLIPHQIFCPNTLAVEGLKKGKWLLFSVW
jgi:hypothetical protein